VSGTSTTLAVTAIMSRACKAVLRAVGMIGTGGTLIVSSRAVNISSTFVWVSIPVFVVSVVAAFSSSVLVALVSALMWCAIGLCFGSDSSTFVASRSSRNLAVSVEGILIHSAAFPVAFRTAVMNILIFAICSVARIDRVVAVWEFVILNIFFCDLYFDFELRWDVWLGAERSIA
jgi:hypothetical protein